MKRAAGEGTIRKLPSGNWCARVTVNGERKSHTATTQRKAREWLTETRRDLDTESYIDPSDMPLSEWWDKWIASDKADNVKQSTLCTYTSSRARLPLSLMELPLSKITRADIQSAFNRLTQSGTGHGTLKLTAIHIKMCLTAAVADKMIKSNPAAGIKLPEEDSDYGELHLLTDEEYSAFVAYCEEPVRMGLRKMNGMDLKSKPYKDALLTILYTGLRRTECVNLMWSDWSDDVLKVRGTKTKKSYRNILLSPETVALFQQREKVRKSLYIFESTNAKPLIPTELLRHINKINGHTVHDLRHTFATRAILAGVDVKTLSEMLGHSSVVTTLKLYVHPTDDSKREAMKKISAARVVNISEVK